MSTSKAHEALVALRALCAPPPPPPQISAHQDDDILRQTKKRQRTQTIAESPTIFSRSSSPVPSFPMTSSMSSALASSISPLTTSSTSSATNSSSQTVIAHTDESTSAHSTTSSDDDDDDESNFVSAEEILERYSMTTQTLRNWVKDGSVRSKRLESGERPRRRYHLADVKRRLERSTRVSERAPPPLLVYARAAADSRADIDARWPDAATIFVDAPRAVRQSGANSGDQSDASHEWTQDKSPAFWQFIDAVLGASPRAPRVALDVDDQLRALIAGMLRAFTRVIVVEHSRT